MQVEEPQRRAVGGTITTGRIHKGIKIHNFMINTSVFTSYRKTEIYITTFFHREALAAPRSN